MRSLTTAAIINDRHARIFIMRPEIILFAVWPRTIHVSSTMRGMTFPCPGVDRPKNPISPL
jgi:hypothetical protein